jgi:hypothetical protein
MTVHLVVSLPKNTIITPYKELVLAFWPTLRTTEGNSNSTQQPVLAPANTPTLIHHVCRV